MEEKIWDNREYKLLKKIKTPKDLENIENLNDLCKEIRKKLIEVTSANGGHLSSNLGVVELSVALHKVFSSAEDKIIWDVGHQSYVHKMLTGRFENMDTVRSENGISGFTNREESKYDVFTAGHSSTSVSSALGIAQSKKILKKSGHTVAVIGDGALTGGLAYEGLNNVDKARNFTLVLNDNKMSISKNVGAIARCLSAARIRPSYMKAKNILGNILEKTSLGLKIENLMKRSKSALKSFIYQSSIFEDMGFVYYGPIDGHDIQKLTKVLKLVKNMNHPTLVHVVTTKGKGYGFAEKKPHEFHAVSPFNIFTGEREKKESLTFSEVFGEKLCDIAKKNNKVCAITAAMSSGTGLNKFKSCFKSRFFDVGIAEGHAVTFSAGLAAGGLLPVFAVYSSFLQRSYDQILHDASMQKLKIILAIDRAGFIGEDGEAHQGLFDVSFLNTIPNVKIFAPCFFEELKNMMDNIFSKEENKIFAIRYPRGKEFFRPGDFVCSDKDFGFYGNKNSKILIVTYGRIFSQAALCFKKLKEENIDVCILKLNVIKPVNFSACQMSANFEHILFFEESVKSSGVGEKFGNLLLECENFKGTYRIYAVEDEFVAHASVENQLKKYSLDCAGIEKAVKSFLSLRK